MELAQYSAGSWAESLLALAHTRLVGWSTP
jgi:hypothetical protein